MLALFGNRLLLTMFEQIAAQATLSPFSSVSVNVIEVVVKGAYFIEHAPVNFWGSIVFIKVMQVKINTRMAEEPRRSCRDGTLKSVPLFEADSL